jgi:hypothetical protein
MMRASADLDVPPGIKVRQPTERCHPGKVCVAVMEVSPGGIVRAVMEESSGVMMRAAALVPPVAMVRNRNRGVARQAGAQP